MWVYRSGAERSDGGRGRPPGHFKFVLGPDPAAAVKNLLYITLKVLCKSVNMSIYHVSPSRWSRRGARQHIR